MSEMTIDEADRDAAVGGGELIPVSDAGSPKSVSIAQIKDYALTQIAALSAASGISIDDDSVYILRGGVATRVVASTLAAAIMNEAFGRAAVASPNGNEVLAVKDSTLRKTITFTALKEWLEANMTVTPDLTLSDAANAGTLGDSDVTLVVQAAAGKKVALGTLKDYVLGKLAAFITAQTAAQSVSSSDVIYLLQGGNMRKATVAQLMAGAGGGDVKGPSTTTENKIPQWDSVQKKLKDGLEIVSTLNSASDNPSDNPPTDTQVPTAAAVRTAIDAAGQATNFVKKTGDESVAGTKTFTSSPLVPNILDGNNAIVTDDNSQKSASTAWVTAKLAAWWTTIKAAAQTISGVWTFSASPSVPAPTNDGDAANKKYVTDNAMFLTGDQAVAGVKTFSSSPVVPTVEDSSDSSTKAASTGFVQAVVQAFGASLRIVPKTATGGKFRLDDHAINTLTLEAGDNGYVLVEPPTKVEGIARSTVFALTVTGTGSVSFSFGYESEEEEDTVMGESATTFTLEAGTQVFYFDEYGTNNFFVRRRTFSATSVDDMFSGNISE